MNTKKNKYLLKAKDTGLLFATILSDTRDPENATRFCLQTAYIMKRNLGDRYEIATLENGKITAIKAKNPLEPIGLTKKPQTPKALENEIKALYYQLYEIDKSGNASDYMKGEMAMLAYVYNFIKCKDEDDMSLLEWAQDEFVRVNCDD